MNAIFLATLLLLWDYPREVNPDAFLLIAVHQGTTETYRVAPSVLGVCPGVPPATYCAQWPTCPSAGEITFTVQAAVGEQLSAANDPPQTCLFDAAAPCECLPIEPDAMRAARPFTPVSPPPSSPPLAPQLLLAASRVTQTAPPAPVVPAWPAHPVAGGT